MTVSESTVALLSSLKELEAALNEVEQDSGQLASLLENTDLLTTSLRSLMRGPDGHADDASVDDEWETFMASNEELVEKSLASLLKKGKLTEEELDDLLRVDEDEAEDGDEEEMGTESDNDSDGSDLSASEELRLLTQPVQNSDSEDVDEEDEEDEEDDSGADGDDGSNRRVLFADDEQDEDGLSTRQSSFERAQAALQAQIAGFEEENVSHDRPWALRGEITARQRPKDSLLEEVVEFEQQSRPVPQITEERTEKIEDIIRRRITEAAWDDVQRKTPRDLTLVAGEKEKAQRASAKPLLEDVMTSGAKRSLSQVYEDQVDAQVNGATSPVDDATKANQALLTGLFAKICRHIDGLSGNRFVPKVYAQSDIQIKTLKK